MHCPANLPPRRIYMEEEFKFQSQYLGVFIKVLHSRTNAFTCVCYLVYFYCICRCSRDVCGFDNAEPISTPAASSSVVPLNGLRLLNALEVSDLPPAVFAIHSACGAAPESPCISSLISAALLMLRLHGPPEPFTFWNQTPLPVPPPSLPNTPSFFHFSLPLSSYHHSQKKFTSKMVASSLFSIDNQSNVFERSPPPPPPPSQPPAHPGLQRSRLHSALELDGGRPGVHLPDLPLGPLPARAVPAGRAPAVVACPCGGGVLRVAQVLTLHKSFKGPVCVRFGFIYDFYIGKKA